MDPVVAIGLNAVIMAVTEGSPRILTVQRSGLPGTPSLPRREEEALIDPTDAIPFGPLDPSGDRTLELGLRRWVREQTGLELGYVEQLYTFGDRNRDPSEGAGGPRVVSVAYLALVREVKPAGTAGADWKDWYLYFPWEDWRNGRPPVIEKHIAPALHRWIQASPNKRVRQERRERGDIHFGLSGAPWVPERVLERYELLYEIGLAVEALRDRSAGQINNTNLTLPAWARQMGRGMALDHRRMLATALGRLRGKLKYRPVVFELLPPAFTLLQLQLVVEALAGVHLHKQNLRRLVERGGLVEGTGRMAQHTGGRPAELFRFRREVLRERPTPGVGIPGIRPSS